MIATSTVAPEVVVTKLEVKTVDFLRLETYDAGNLQRAKHADGKKGVTQCPKHRKADLELARYSLQRSTLFFK